MSSILEVVNDLAKKEGLLVIEHNDMLQLCKEGLSTFVNVEKLDNDYVFVFLAHRTTSAHLPGERTDAHDVYSVLLATYLRICATPYSSVILDVYNPIVAVPNTEVYARYLVLEQPNKPIIHKDEISLEDIVTLFNLITDFEKLFPYFFRWKFKDEKNYNDEGEVVNWAKKVAQVTGEIKPDLDIFYDEKIQFNQRWGPDWLYYRSIRKNITVIESPFTVLALRALVEDAKFKSEIDGPNCRLYLSSRVKSAVSYKTERYAIKILSRLNEKKSDKLIVIPFENKILFAEGKFLIFISSPANIYEFQKEVQQIKQRHHKEAMLLFPAKKYVWNEKIDDDHFESLIKELLTHEPGVVWVRKVGKSRDPDRGKDLLVDWYTPLPTEVPIPENAVPIKRRKILVQVKASLKSVNKGMVKDIRDTMENHNATGFFLAVSSQITSSLTDYLDRMRSDGKYWADWWNRSEIEERLNRYPEIAEKYSDIVCRIE